jgi:hypothetical protein
VTPYKFPGWVIDLSYRLYLPAQYNAAQKRRHTPVLCAGLELATPLFDWSKTVPNCELGVYKHVEIVAESGDVISAYSYGVCLYLRGTDTIRRNRQYSVLTSLNTSWSSTQDVCLFIVASYISKASGKCFLGTHYFFVKSNIFFKIKTLTCTCYWYI